MSSSSDYTSPVDLDSAEQKGMVSDIKLLVVSFVYFLNIVISALYVWLSKPGEYAIWINVGLVAQNVVSMFFVVALFNKYKH